MVKINDKAITLRRNHQVLGYKKVWNNYSLLSSMKNRFLGKADLHLHSTYSDGLAKPKHIVTMAAYCGFTYLSLTDHESVAGTNEFNNLCKSISIKPINGVEVSATLWGDQRIHVLGFAIDISNTNLLKALKENKDHRYESIVNIAKIINNSLRDYQANNLKRIGPRNIIRPNGSAIDNHDLSMIHRLLFVENKYFGPKILMKILNEKGFPLHSITNRSGISASEHIKNICKTNPLQSIQIKSAISAIHNAGGLVFIAHPFGMISSTAVAAKNLKISALQLINTLLDKYDIDGLEIYHPDHTESQINQLIKLAHRRKILISGGSDSHWNVAHKNNKPFGFNPKDAFKPQEWMDHFFK